MIGKPRKAARSAPCRHRRARHRDETTRDCAPIAARPGRGATDMSAASASPGAEGGEIRAIYIPMRHPDSENFDPAQVYRWLKDHDRGRRALRHPERPLRLGLAAHRRRHPDAALRSARRSRRARHHGRREPAQILASTRCASTTVCPARTRRCCDEAVEAAGFKISKKDSIADPTSGRLPARYVGPYAEIDAVRTLELFETLNADLDREGTRDAYRLEVDLLPMVHGDAPPRHPHRSGRRRAGATICLIGKRDAALAELSDQHGAAVGMDEINGRKWKEQTFDEYGIAYPRTAKGNPSFCGRRNRDGWPNTSTGCRAGSRPRSKYDHAGEQVSRRTHPRPHRQRAHLWRDPPVHLRMKAARVSFRFSLLESAAATNAERATRKSGR